MRIAFFGGSFDPPHCGHVAIALAAAERLSLDQVLVAPVGSQPLKGGLSTAGYADRLAMVRQACAGPARLAASALDAPRADGGHNYTYETLTRLKEQLLQEDAATKLFCLLGADSFQTLAHWHRAAELLLLCDFIVAARPGYELQTLPTLLPRGVFIAGERESTGVVDVHLQASEGGSASTLHLLLDLEEDVSATALRDALATGQTGVAGLMLPAGVAHYIREHQLYA